jgi:2-dehydro-3-deoxygalactonokinase
MIKLKTHAENTGENVCAIYLDMGTTNTRGWLMSGCRVIARVSAAVGVRDTARDGSKKRIHDALRKMIENLRAQFKTTSKTASKSAAAKLTAPTCIAAVGMIGSPLGLADVPHVASPAGLAEIAAASKWFQFPEVTDLPVLLVPGVRSGPAQAGPAPDWIHTADVMRGEETLCIGLSALGYVGPSAVVLNLGSHWKAIQLDADGRIASSITSLSGELIHAAQTQTVLASSVPHERVTTISERWKEAGMKEQRRSGLARALFSVRLLGLANQGTPQDRLSFLIGAFIASDMDALILRGVLSRNTQVAIVAGSASAQAWRSALAAISVPATVLSVSEAEDALLTGLRCTLEKCLTTKDAKEHKAKPHRGGAETRRRSKKA